MPETKENTERGCSSTQPEVLEMKPVQDVCQQVGKSTYELMSVHDSRRGTDPKQDCYAV